MKPLAEMSLSEMNQERKRLEVLELEVRLAEERNQAAEEIRYRRKQLGLDPETGEMF